MTVQVSGFSSRLAVTIASFFYVGFIPIIPGTFGSLAAFAIYFLLLQAGMWEIYVATVAFLVAIGIWAAGRAEKDSKIVDPSFVVVDEVAGQLITLFLLPSTWLWLAAAFLMFRAMDIIKPFPAGRAEMLPGGLGIMTDDVMAGIYGCALLHLGRYLLL